MYRKLFLLFALALPLAAQDAATPVGGCNENGKTVDCASPPAKDEVPALKARIAELEKQLALQSALTIDFHQQFDQCNVNLTVMRAQQPKQEPTK